MPTRKQQVHTEDWNTIRQLCLWKEQVAYERLRPVVLFGDTPAERAQQTQDHERTLRRHADAFDHQGMGSLFAAPASGQSDNQRTLPPPIRQLIVDVYTQCPSLSQREIAQICYVQFNRRPSHHTIKDILAHGPPPTTRERWFPPYAQIRDGFQRRRAVVMLHAQGWSRPAIAEYLQMARSTVHEALKRWRDEDLAGLLDKSRANIRPVRKVDLRAKLEIRKLQENPALGAFRVQSALKQIGIHLSRATCGRILAENRQLYGLAAPSPETKEPREHPFKAEYRHHIWSVDVRYIERHQIPTLTRPFYCISILDNFSRAILASEIVERQDVTAYLIVLYAAFWEEWNGKPAQAIIRQM